MYKYSTFRLGRTLPLAILLVALGAGVFFFAKNQDALSNFKPYYLTSYRAAVAYAFSSHGQTVSSKDSATSIPVLLYHGIVSDKSSTDNVEGYSLRVSTFNAQMLALKNAGYHTVSINDYYDFIYRGKHLPKKSFLLTFDDGRKDSYYPVQPIIHALGFRATMFVITGHSLGSTSNDFYLTKAELLQMKASGDWDLQPHTRNGHYMVATSPNSSAPFFANKLWLKDQNRLETDAEYSARVKQDLVDARNDVISQLGITPVSWAVPFSDLGDNVTNFPGAKQALLAAASKIYPLIFRQFTIGLPYAQNYIGSKQEVDVRIEPKPDWTPDALLQAIHQSDAKDLPYTVSPSATDGWLNPWGNSFALADGLHLAATRIPPEPRLR